jgi:GTP-binding protein EngB required for normal cell division
MIEAQQLFVTNLNEISRAIEAIELNPAINENIQKIRATISDAQLTVPVVGAFSSGKSSLINSFLGTDILNVGVTPETSLATELHYGTENRVEAVKKNNESNRFTPDQSEVRTLSSKEYQYLRYYLNNKHLQEIEPLILVDMPGFDSPLDAHNQAIISYLSRAVHFIILMSVEDGTLPMSILRQLIDLQYLGHSFDFIISKTDLRSTTDVQAVTEEIQDKIQVHLDCQPQIHLAGIGGVFQLADVLRKLDSNQIFKKIYQEQALAAANDVLAAINTRLAALSNKQEDNQRIIQQLTDSMAKMQEKADELKDNTKEKADFFNINMVVNEVGSKLSASIDELVSLIGSNNSDGAERAINSIVRSTLLHHLQDFIKEQNESAVASFSYELQAVVQELPSSGINKEMFDKLSSYLTGKMRQFLGQKQVAGASEVPGKSGDTTKQSAQAHYRVIATITAVTTSIVGPVVEILIIFLPDILNALVTQYAKARQQKEIRQKILTEIIPAIKAKLRQEIPSLVQSQTATLIDSIGEEMRGKFAALQSEIIRVEEGQKNDNFDLQQKQEQYIQARDRIMELAQTMAAC